MLSRVSRHIATGLAALIGIAGLVAVLYAWKLPPFDAGLMVTEDAYVRGQVTALAPQLSGIVANVDVQDYERVRQGALLVKIDDRIYRQKLAQAEATLDAAEASLENAEQDRKTAEARIESAKAGVDSAEATLKLAEANVQRSDKLRARGVVAERTSEEQTLARDQARAARDQANAELETARQNLASIITNRQSLEASVESAEAAVQLARIDLDNTEITAPVDGRLGEVSARLGQYVTAGTRVATIVPDKVWVVANFKETQVRGMKVGQPVKFTVDALGDAPLSGRIEDFSPATGSEFSVLAASNATGNFIKIAQRIPVRIAIDPDQPLADSLAPGMSVVARIDTIPAGPGTALAAGTGPSPYPRHR